jgi:hypothetical protein
LCCNIPDKNSCFEGIWEENNCRKYKPWNGNTLTRGLEFGKTYHISFLSE